MRELLVIGMGPGHPDQITVQAVRALNRAGVFFRIDKGDAKSGLNAARDEILARHVTATGWRMVDVPEPPRDRSALLDRAGYEGAVADWHQARAEALIGAAVAAELGPDGVGAFLVWGDPSVYDSMLRIIDRATLLACAPHQAGRGRAGPACCCIASDLRERRRVGRESNLVLFLVDASGSMAARRRMEAVKGAVLSLLLDAYQRRDKVGLICFRASGAQVLLPPTSSVDAAARRLQAMPAGGRTPLAAGLAEARATLARERLRDPRRRPLLVIVTDGRHTKGGDPAAAAAALRGDGIACVVVDCEAGPCGSAWRVPWRSGSARST